MEIKLTMNGSLLRTESMRMKSGLWTRSTSEAMRIVRPTTLPSRWKGKVTAYAPSSADMPVPRITVCAMNVTTWRPKNNAIA